ncbi:MAG: NAD-dependent epimerase/dehydratase family protein, partial [Anaerolineae bacterium]|nr:NAD-dependent epimerase/dehydratase family protein [Anaerolineae bacterium]
YFSSGGTIYGPTPAVRDETTPLAPQSPYGQHKQRCEEIICESGVRYLIVRLANLVGSNQNPAQLLPALIQQVMNGHVRVQRFAHRDLLDVTDFASILDRLLAVTEFSDTVVLASGQSIAVPRLVETIQTILNVSAKIEVVDSGEPQQFSIDRLRSYLPNISFETDYPYRVIQRTISRQYGETLEHLP